MPTVFVVYIYLYISIFLVINFYFSNCNVAIRFHLNRFRPLYIYLSLSLLIFISQTATLLSVSLSQPFSWFRRRLGVRKKNYRRVERRFLSSPLSLPSTWAIINSPLYDQYNRTVGNVLPTCYAGHVCNKTPWRSRAPRGEETLRRLFSARSLGSPPPLP